MTHQRLYTVLARLQIPGILWALLAGTLLAGIVWLWVARPPLTPDFSPTSQVEVLRGPVIATMQSPAFVYDGAWQISATGADPDEPADPWREPAGTVHFTYTGAELSLLLAAGDYWGYLYITVDGEPANLLPVIAGNLNSQGERSGYRTLYAPEQQTAAGPKPQWIRVHRAGDATRTHAVTIEIWRSWQQIPLRGVAIDALPKPPLPRWPGVALLLCAGGLLLMATQRTTERPFARPARRVTDWLRPVLFPWHGERVALYLAPIALLVLGTGTAWRSTPLTLAALALLAWCGLQRPTVWTAALLLGLPFYYTYTLPILPTRALSLIDLGLFGGLAILLVRWVLASPPQLLVGGDRAQPTASDRSEGWMTLFLALLICWALLAASEATQVELALREWRTVFLNGGLFALLLWGTRRTSTQLRRDQHIILGAWIGGALLVAVVGIWQSVSNEMVINAEGVQRVRGFYGSPNNLALYLERALALVLALALFARQGWWRWLAAGSAAILGSALLLTFSKGALLLGIPAMLGVLWIGGLALLRQRGQSRRLLWLLAGIALVVLLALTPFLATERFQRLLDFEAGTGFVRLQLWRSAWQMALDHPLFGVGPDNFLYAYRSFYLLPAAWQEPNLNHPHNWPLDWWTRLGLPGLLLALGWFVILLRRHWRLLRANQQPVLHLGLLAAAIAALAHGLIDASYALPDLMLIWVLLTYLPRTETITETEQPHLPLG